MSPLCSIRVVGGTGAKGGGLALRWAKHGHRVTIGSRDKARALTAADELNCMLGADLIVGGEGVAAAEIAVLTVPFQAELATLRGLKRQLVGKVLIDVTVPLVPPNVSWIQLLETESGIVASQELLGDQVKVVSAFQNVSALELKDLSYEIDCDVLVAGDDGDARGLVIALAGDAGFRGTDVVSLANSVVAESVTSERINKYFKIPDSRMRITHPAKYWFPRHA